MKVPVITPDDLAELKFLTPDLDFTDAERQAALLAAGSSDVNAAPGSGKTSVLAAKLLLLARKWTYDKRGICVLSHTNVAREEIQRRLGATADGSRLLAYPSNRFDLAEALPVLAGLKPRDPKVKETILSQFRNLYVGMSRPTSLLCVAVSRVDPRRNDCRDQALERRVQRIRIREQLVEARLVFCGRPYGLGQSGARRRASIGLSGSLQRGYGSGPGCATTARQRDAAQQSQRAPSIHPVLRRSSPPTRRCPTQSLGRGDGQRWPMRLSSVACNDQASGVATRSTCALRDVLLSVSASSLFRFAGAQDSSRFVC